MKRRPAAGSRRTPDVAPALAELRRLATRRTLEGLPRYGIPSDRAFGVSVGDIQRLARRLGTDHALAAALWRSGWYEARLPASLALHDRQAGDAAFLRCLPLVGRGAADGRNFVKQGVSWAPRSVGQRSAALHAAAVAGTARFPAATRRVVTG